MWNGNSAGKMNIARLRHPQGKPQQARELLLAHKKVSSKNHGSDHDYLAGHRTT